MQVERNITPNKDQKMTHVTWFAKTAVSKLFTQFGVRLTTMMD